MDLIVTSYNDGPSSYTLRGRWCPSLPEGCAALDERHGYHVHLTEDAVIEGIGVPRGVIVHIPCRCRVEDADSGRVLANRRKAVLPGLWAVMGVEARRRG